MSDVMARILAAKRREVDEARAKVGDAEIAQPRRARLAAARLRGGAAQARRRRAGPP